MKKKVLFLISISFYYKTDIYCKAALADLIKFDVFHDWLYPMWESDTYEWKVEVKSVIDILCSQFKFLLSFDLIIKSVYDL